MARLVQLQCVAFDTKGVAGEATIPFFDDRQGRQAESVAATTEAAIVGWLFETSVTRTLLLDVLQMPSSTEHELRVGYPFTDSRSKPGDIDALLVDGSAPQRAVALECKRVKVTATDDAGGQHVNRIEQLGRAADQANGLARLGFSRTYLAAVALVDARASVSQGFVFRGTTDKSFTRLFDTALGIPLEPEVGVLYIEVDQPVDESLATAGMVKAAVLRPAAAREQGEHLTNRLVNFMRSSERGSG